VQDDLLLVNYKAAQEHKYNTPTIKVGEKGKGTRKILAILKNNSINKALRQKS